MSNIIQQLEAGGWLSADAWVYLEAERGQVYELPPNWTVHRSKTAGQVALRWLIGGSRSTFVVL